MPQPDRRTLPLAVLCALLLLTVGCSDQAMFHPVAALRGCDPALETAALEHVHLAFYHSSSGRVTWENEAAYQREDQAIRELRAWIATQPDPCVRWAYEGWADYAANGLKDARAAAPLVAAEIRAEHTIPRPAAH